jgi:hypothetical protein
LQVKRAHDLESSWLAFTNIEDGIFLHHQNRKAMKSRNQNIKEQISRLESRKQKLLKIWNHNSKFYLRYYFLFYLLKIQHFFKLEHKYLSCWTHKELKTKSKKSFGEETGYFLHSRNKWYAQSSTINLFFHKMSINVYMLRTISYLLGSRNTWQTSTELHY